MIPTITYLVDTFTIYAASAIAANSILRSLGGALLPIAGLAMYGRLGLGRGEYSAGFYCDRVDSGPIAD
jgi:hypothetical protein